MPLWKYKWPYFSLTTAILVRQVPRILMPSTNVSAQNHCTACLLLEFPSLSNNLASKWLALRESRLKSQNLLLRLTFRETFSQLSPLRSLLNLAQSARVNSRLGMASERMLRGFCPSSFFSCPCRGPVITIAPLWGFVLFCFNMQLHVPAYSWMAQLKT